MFRKISLIDSPTPLLELRQLARHLGCKARIFIKCDDMAPMGGAGNKLRKLEYLAADALEQGADTLVTTGGLQSNHARLTAAVAARLGLRCELVLSKLVANDSANYANNGNVLLMRSFGAKLHVLEKEQDAKAYARTLLQDLRAANRKPYFIPFGGSTVQGALGYVDCAHEIKRQLAAHKLKADMVFCTTGSGGTQAGLLAGFSMAGCQTRVRGISVLHPCNQIKPMVSSLLNGILALLQQKPLPPNDQTVIIDERFIGDGYGIPSAAGLEAMKLLSRTEGILLDPVYTGKTFAGLLDAIQQEQWSEQTTVVFLHSGGTPALYAYADALTDYYLQQSEEPIAPLPPAVPVTRIEPDWKPIVCDINCPATIVKPDRMSSSCGMPMVKTG